VAPSALTLFGSGGILPLTSPATLPLLNGGASANFTWTYTAVGTGTLILSGNASGTDVMTGIAVSSSITASNLVSVQSPANLAFSSFVASPSPLGTGLFGTVVLGVSNTGQTTALNVSITSFGPSLANVVGISSGPLPAIVGSLPSGTVAFLHLHLQRNGPHWQRELHSPGRRRGLL